jgi:hypothetical protein
LGIDFLFFCGIKETTKAKTLKMNMNEEKEG